MPTIPTDPLYPTQWHFPLLGDIETIWDEYTGAGVHVGVYDDGVEYTHPDLAGNYDPSLHFQSGGTTYIPYPIAAGAPGDAHGTSVAGLIAATDNNGLGGTGVAHGAILTGVNFLGDLQYQSFALALESLDWARNFDIMSNSWGRTPNYETSQSLALPASARSQINAEYGDVVEFGRGGLGTVILQAAGNDTLNGNGDGLNVSRYTATIAATDSSGNVTDYSNFGAGILVAAPAGAVTTDRQGANGYNTTPGVLGDYTDSFGGTSAATPVTSGVVALMLEANSGLGWRDVQNILAISAAQTGSAYGGAGTGFEVGNWGANGATNWNGGGMSFHQSYGFGMVDAFAAVRMAEVWNVMHGAAQTTANEQQISISYGGGPLAIPDFSGGTPGQLGIALDVTSDIRIEDIYVTVNMQHTWSGDLILTLIGPNGEEIILMNREGGSTLMDSGFEWTFGATGALGMMSAGTWTLRITDNAGGDVGTVSNVTFDFFGATATTNDVHHFTQDLFTLIGVEASRMTISDTNGGTDWLNFAAMGAINITVNFNNATVAFSSSPVTLSLVGAFENAVTGDGNDMLFGNSAHNHLMGMRGNDSLSGDGGNDTLNGGQDNDTLLGSSGNDLLVGEEGDDWLYGGINNDVLYGQNGVDRLLGEGGSDTLYGGALRDFMFGGDGNDVLFGQDGNDILYGGSQNDYLVGGENEDMLYGEAGGDTLLGGNGHDTLDGGGANDSLAGGAGNDSLLGGDGGDTLLGGDGNDVLVGGENDDWVYGGINNDVLYGQGGNDRLIGEGGNDTLYGGALRDFLFGDDGNDVLFGQDGNDILYGGGQQDYLAGGNNQDYLAGDGGNDTLLGGNGLDTLNGGAGNDSLTGGTQSDTFVFVGNFGTDTITDFDAFDDNEDIDLSGVASITSFADLTNPGNPHMTQVGADVVIDDFSGNTITILNVNIADMNAADFTF